MFRKPTLVASLHSPSTFSRARVASHSALVAVAIVLGATVVGGCSSTTDSNPGTNNPAGPGGVTSPSGVTIQTIAGKPNTSGIEDGTGIAARFGRIEGLAVQKDGTIWVCDSSNNTVRRVTPGGAVTTPYGKPKSAGKTDGVGPSALFDESSALSLDESSGQAIVTIGQGPKAVLRSMNVTAMSASTTLGDNQNELPDLGDGALASHGVIAASLAAGKPEGGKPVIWVSQLNVPLAGGAQDGPALRKITDGQITSIPLGSASLTGFIQSMVVSAGGDVYGIIGLSNSEIIKVSGGVVSSFAGKARGFGSNAPAESAKDGVGAAAVFETAPAITIDPSTGNLYVLDAGGIRQITPAGVVTTLFKSGDLEFPDGVSPTLEYFAYAGPKTFIAASQTQIIRITLP
jgi:serine/threonine protein kinase, bacterial